MHHLHYILCIQNFERGAGWSSGYVLGLRSKRSGVRLSASPLEFQRLVISCLKVAIWLKYRSGDVNPQYNQPNNQPKTLRVYTFAKREEKYIYKTI